MYSLDLFVLATVIVIIGRRIILRTTTRIVVTTTPSGVVRKGVAYPSAEALRLIGRVLSGLLLVFELLIGVFCYLSYGARFEGLMEIFPKALTAAVLWALFDGVTETDPAVVRRLVQRDEDRLRAEYLRLKEEKEAGKEVQATEYRIGKKIYRI